MTIDKQFRNVNTWPPEDIVVRDHQGFMERTARFMGYMSGYYSGDVTGENKISYEELAKVEASLKNKTTEEIEREITDCLKCLVRGWDTWHLEGEANSDGGKAGRHLSYVIATQLVSPQRHRELARDILHRCWSDMAADTSKLTDELISLDPDQAWISWIWR